MPPSVLEHLVQPLGLPSPLVGTFGDQVAVAVIIDRIDNHGEVLTRKAPATDSTAPQPINLRASAPLHSIMQYQFLNLPLLNSPIASNFAFRDRSLRPPAARGEGAIARHGFDRRSVQQSSPGTPGRHHQ